MTSAQLELPFFTRSTAGDPQPEQDRTHPAQMIIKHCGKQRKHVAHAFHDDFPFGCPGTPDLRDTATVAEQAREAAERHLAVREMELRTYECGSKREFHDAHLKADGVSCPGLQTKRCSSEDTHTHHRWWVIPDAFYWCDGLPGAVYELLSETAIIPTTLLRPIEDVELP